MDDAEEPTARVPRIDDVKETRRMVRAVHSVVETMPLRDKRYIFKTLRDALDDNDGVVPDFLYPHQCITLGQFSVMYTYNESRRRNRNS